LKDKTIEIPQILENLIFLELKRHRYKVATDKVAEKEVDFIIKEKARCLYFMQRKLKCRLKI
jgi:predicted AAA+ superfamily ATPase